MSIIQHPISGTVAITGDMKISPKSKLCYEVGDRRIIVNHNKKSTIWVGMQIMISFFRSLKAEIMVRFKVFMPQSMQVYQFLTTRTSSDIHAICQNALNSQNASTYPRFIQVTNNGNHVTGSLKVKTGATYDYEVLHYSFIIKPRKNLLILVGRGGGARNDVNEFLAQKIESDVRFNVIKSITVPNGNMLKMFSNITTQHNRNIIMKLKTVYDPLQGVRYAKEVYAEIAYQFTENRCASEHRDFAHLIAESKNIEMTFGLLKCAGILSALDDRHNRLIARSDCSFRMYKDIPPTDWNTFVDGVLTFL